MISSAEVVPFELVICLSKEHVQMGATSAGRNPQTNSLETETTEYPFFRQVIAYFVIFQILYHHLKAVLLEFYPADL